MPDYERINDDVFMVRDFFSEAECDDWIAQAEEIGFDEATINTAHGPRLVKDVRNNRRVMLDDESLAADMWSRISDFIPHHVQQWTACGVNERFRFYRYDVGEQFDWHYDGYFQRDNGQRSRLTFMIYLNDGFEGGETSFEDVAVVPSKGLALFFNHPILHKGQPILSGRKYVLRTDVMYRQD